MIEIRRCGAGDGQWKKQLDSSRCFFAVLKRLPYSRINPSFAAQYARVFITLCPLFFVVFFLLLFLSSCSYSCSRCFCSSNFFYLVVLVFFGCFDRSFYCLMLMLMFFFAVFIGLFIV